VLIILLELGLSRSFDGLKFTIDLCLFLINSLFKDFEFIVLDTNLFLSVVKLLLGKPKGFIELDILIE